MTTISRDEFERYRRFIPAVTKTGVMATYQISQHSWYKLRDGKPVKLSVVHRLRDRFLALAGGDQLSSKEKIDGGLLRASVSETPPRHG